MQRNKYVDSYFNMLNHVGDGFYKEEHLEVQKLLQQDRIAQKQISLLQTYGKKLKITLNTERKNDILNPLTPMMLSSNSTKQSGIGPIAQ